MLTQTKKVVILSTLGVFILSIITAIFLSPTASIIVAFSTTIVGLFTTIFSLFIDIRNDLDTKLNKLEVALSSIRQEFAMKAGLPLVGKYLQLQEGSCPLFRHAATQVYQNAIASLEALNRYQLSLERLEDVYYWLGFLFREVSFIKRIKAISFGEFKEWQASDSWWGKSYLAMHNDAYERGIEIERIFIVRNNQHAKSVDAVFQKNVQYHVSVKTAIQGRIKQADLQTANCLLFYNDLGEPVYALVANHDSQGHFQNAVIYGDQQKVRYVAEVYNRIDNISEEYQQVSDLLPKKTA